MTRHDLPRILRYPQPTPPPGGPMAVPPDGRHPLYPTAPKHLSPVTAEIKAVPVQPRHAPQEHLPTEAIPKIDANRQQYPPKEIAWNDVSPNQKMFWLGVICLAVLILIVIAAIYIGTHI